ncbi:hypothetical protein [Streptomyces sp. NPDC085596]
MASVLVVGYDPQAIPGIDGDAPRAALAFNTSGGDSVEAARRWL